MELRSLHVVANGTRSHASKGVRQRCYDLVHSRITRQMQLHEAIRWSQGWRARIAQSKVDVDLSEVNKIEELDKVS